jgi:hypothetical protein
VERRAGGELADPSDPPLQQGRGAGSGEHLMLRRVVQQDIHMQPGEVLLCTALPGGITLARCIATTP